MGVEGDKATIEAKKFLDRVKPDLVINRVPKKTLEEFKDLAREEFCQDYGFCLKWLMDFYFGAIGKGHERAEALAMQALEENAELRSQLQPEKEEKTIHLVNGKELKK